MKIHILFFTLLLTWDASCVFAKDYIPVHVQRGVHMPLTGNPNHCTPVFGVCDITIDNPSPDLSKPFERAGFDPKGHLVIEFLNYDFDNDEWLQDDELILDGDYFMTSETADLLEGEPVIIKAGRYRLDYFPKENKKVVVFN